MADTADQRLPIRYGLAIAAVTMVLVTAAIWLTLRYIPARRAEADAMASVGNGLEAQCDAATRAAKAWQAAGMGARAAMWRDRSLSPCSILAYRRENGQ